MPHKLLSTLILIPLALPACGPPSDGGPAIVTSISGRIFDAETNIAIEGALVQTEPFIVQVFSDAQGRYAIDTGVEPGRGYTLTVSKAGYTDATAQIASVEEGIDNVRDIGMSRAGPILSLSTQSLQIGSAESAGIFRIENIGNTSEALTFTITGVADWISEISPDSGSVTDTPQAVTVTIDRTMLGAGDGPQSSTLDISSNGGAESLAVTVAR